MFACISLVSCSHGQTSSVWGKSPSPWDIQVHQVLGWPSHIADPLHGVQQVGTAPGNAWPLVPATIMFASYSTHHWALKTPLPNWLPFLLCRVLHWPAPALAGVAWPTVKLVHKQLCVPSSAPATCLGMEMCPTPAWACFPVTVSQSQ